MSSASVFDIYGGSCPFPKILIYQALHNTSYIVYSMMKYVFLSLYKHVCFRLPAHTVPTMPYNKTNIGILIPRYLEHDSLVP